MPQNPLHDLTDFEQQLESLSLTQPSDNYVRKGNGLLKAKTPRFEPIWRHYFNAALASALVVSLGFNVFQSISTKENTSTSPSNQNSEISFNNRSPNTNQTNTSASLMGSFSPTTSHSRDTASLYTQYCQICHEEGIGGAPRTGHEEDWIPRVAKGMDALVKNSVFSFSANSPCADCSASELEMIIEYMVPSTIPRLVNQSVQYLADMYYKTLSSPIRVDEGERAEVQSLFWYGCYPCYNFDTLLSQWESSMNSDAVSVTRIPAVWSSLMATHARAYYAALHFSQSAEIHESLFSALNSAKESYVSADSIAPLFEQHGVSFEEFLEAFDATETKAQVDDARILTRKLNAMGMNGVPGVIVNGKYLVNNTDSNEMLKVIETLILEEKERSTRCYTKSLC